jgi:hypothetical protein
MQLIPNNRQMQKALSGLDDAIQTLNDVSMGLDTSYYGDEQGEIKKTRDRTREIDATINKLAAGLLECSMELHQFILDLKKSKELSYWS